MADLIIAIIIGAFAGLLLGPVLAYWSVRFEDALDRHRAHCTSCKWRAEKRRARHD